MLCDFEQDAGTLLDSAFVPAVALCYCLVKEQYTVLAQCFSFTGAGIIITYPRLVGLNRVQLFVKQCEVASRG